MKIAVSGANGRVGSVLCKALIERGHQIKALIYKHSKEIQDLPLEQVPGNTLEKDSLKRLLNDVDCCYHLAAHISISGDPDGMVWRINAEGTRNMVEVALERGVKRFIHFSSIHAFQQHPQDQLLDETRPLVGSNGFAYDVSKAAGERFVKAAVDNGLNALILCPTAITGPDDPEPSLIGQALLELCLDQIPALVPGGYNWVDVRDVVDAAINALTMGTRGEKYLLSGKWYSLLELSKLIEQITGQKTPQKIMPMWIARIGLPFITLYSKLTGVKPLYTSESLTIISEGHRQISNEKAKKELGFTSRNLDETIRDAFTWFEDNGYLH